MTAAPSLFQRLTRLSLVTQIVIGLIAGIALALLLPRGGESHRVLSAKCLSPR